MSSPYGKWKVCPALALDLDGTVRYSTNGEFINTPDDIALYDGVEDKLWDYRNAGYLLFAVSNQGGVAFGHKTPQGNDAELERMLSLFNENPFHSIQAAYHHPQGTVRPYCYRSLYRKPDIGMLADCEAEAFEARYVVDWDKSLLVGDRNEDQEMARRAGITFEWAHEFFGRN